MMSPVGRHPLPGKEGASQWQMTWVAKNSSQIKKQKQWIEATVCHRYRTRFRSHRAKAVPIAPTCSSKPVGAGNPTIVAKRFATSSWMRMTGSIRACEPDPGPA